MNSGYIFMYVLIAIIILLWVLLGVQSYRKKGRKGLNTFIKHVLITSALLGLIWFALHYPHLMFDDLPGVPKNGLLSAYIVAVALLITWPVIALSSLSKK